MTVMRSAVLDLGSNSFHLLVADLEGRSVAPVLREREMLHLGRVVAAHGEVTPEAWSQAVATVAHLAELARRAGAEQRLAVATAAIRDAANGHQLLAELSEVAGTTVQVLDGHEEARLAYLGARAAVAIRASPTLVLDLGGGSLEFALGSGDRIVWSASLPIGASRLSTLVDDDPMSDDERLRLLARVDDELDGVQDQLLSHSPQETVLVGGSVRALARVAAARSCIWLPATLNQFRLETDEVIAQRDELAGMDLRGRLAVPGMKERRADHLHIAAVIVARTMERLGLSSALVSAWGLREGLLLDAHGVSTVPAAAELRAGDVERVRRTFVPDDPHPPHVAMLARQLFDGTRARHGLGAIERELLDHAARLHAVGESLALRRQHVHGAYLMENAELRGFAPWETALLATLVRFHRSRGIAASYPPFATLADDRKEVAHRLLALLQLADGLDRAHDQAVTGVTVVDRDDEVELQLTGGGLHMTDDEMRRATRLLRSLFDVEVVVTDLAGDA